MALSQNSVDNSLEPVEDPIPDTYLAKHDYLTDEMGQLSIRKGEQLLICRTSDNSYWHEAVNLRGERRWIPASYVAKKIDLFIHSWFQGNVSRAEAELSLRCGINGSYLVRESESSPEQYSISLRYNGHVYHYGIHMDKLTSSYYIKPKTKFNNIPDLVSHHSRYADGLETVLKYPTSNPHKPSRPSHHEVDKWEVNRSDIEIGLKIGQGGSRHGDVYKGIKRGMKIAVKTFGERSRDPDDFIHEINIMKQLRHPNIVQILGVCTRELPIFILLEFMPKGDLLNCLRAPDGRDLDLATLVYMGQQICTAMCYLESKSIIHCDLVAWNCLVGDHYLVKVTDFRLSHVLDSDVYYAKKCENITTKWNPPETLRFNLFSIKSDVWAFGVLLWELTTYGMIPYSSIENSDLYDLLEMGYRMECPDGCPPNLYDTMKHCWEWEPDNRPTFKEVHTTLRAISDVIQVTPNEKAPKRDEVTTTTDGGDEDYYDPPDDDYKEETDEFIDGVEEAFDKDGKIDRKLAHFMFVGPTGSGKTSLMDRLLNNPRKVFSPSTGICNSIIIVDIDIDNPTTFHSVTILETEAWKEVECDVSLVRQMGQESIVIPSKLEKVESDYSFAHGHEPAHKSPSSLPEVKPTNVSPASSSHDASHSAKRVPVFVFTGRVSSIIKKHGFKSFKKFLKKTCSLYFRDTGGLVEFQEMLSLLIYGPSIFFFVFRMDLDFKSKFTVQYRKSAKESINCYTSSITTEEALLQCLASVYAMDTSDEEGVKTHKPMVFIVGTHADKLGSDAADKIANLNKQLDELIESNGFKDLVQYSDGKNGLVMFTVDNTSDSDADFLIIRSKVNNLITVRQEFNIEYPISYLLFILDLQNVKESVLTLDECRVLAARYGIVGNQVFHLLQFLHLRIGIIRYFNVDGLRHLIVKEPQVLFNKVTDLIVRTFTSDALRTSERSDYEKKGILAASAFESVVSSSDKFSPREFLQLLVHLRIIAPFSTPGDQGERYFIPGVLNHVPAAMDEYLVTDILPLMFNFKCRHSPKGIFGVLVTHVLSPELDRNDDNTTFILLQDKIFRDQISFEVHSVGVQDEMSIKYHSSHLEVNFYHDLSDDRDTSIHEVCSNVRQILNRSIFRALKDLHYSKDRVEPVMCFKCTHCRELHPVKKGLKWHKLFCNKVRKSSRIPSGGRCWFNEVDESLPPSQLVHPELEDTKPCLKDCPPLSMITLEHFELKDGKYLNIPSSVGVKYELFGHLLLEDTTGQTTSNIVHKHMRDAPAINREILCEWIAGTGKKPVEWSTLVNTLHDMQLNALAKNIADNVSIGNVV